jgi:very-short-patch-repair endonuclease
MANRIARHLRKHQTVAETQLWRELRKLRHQGYHFRRQAPIATYIVDFACLSQRVIIEVDGVQHDEPAARRADAARDEDLGWRGFKLLRFRNSDVAESLEGVMLEVLAAHWALWRNRSGTESDALAFSPHP